MGKSLSVKKLPDRNCEFCNKKLELKFPSDPRRFCNRSCSNFWLHKFGGKKGGFQKPLFQQWVDKFGIEIALEKEAARNYKHSASVSGKLNHFYGKDHSDEFKKKSSLIHKGKVIPKSVKEKMSISHSTRIASGEGYNPSSVKCEHGVFKSKNGSEFNYASSYELKRMQFLDDSKCIISWTNKHSIKIPYTVHSADRHYIPDLLVETSECIFLEEIKGYVRDKDEHEAKCVAAEKYCLEHGWKYRILYKNDLEKL